MTDSNDDGKNQKKWDNKFQYMLAQIGFAVSLENS